MNQQAVHFTKMHGAGNDYIYVNSIEHSLSRPDLLAALWSDRHKGIGADGLVLIGPSESADFSMRIFNADGSEAMMCGNAVRCIGKYLYEKGLSRKEVIRLETLSGVKELRLAVSNGLVKEVRVDMGLPSTGELRLALAVGSETYTGTVVSMGNPHYVIFVDKAEDTDIYNVGPMLERHPRFAPERTNVEFVEIRNPGEIRMRVWERGSGVTMACGTGACASVVAGAALGLTARKVKVEMDGGEVTVEWAESDGHVYKTGGAETVFEGTIII
ncbi:MAG: diaminopimelate epimerase [Tannerellaceae bacterium]|nr:diaminopimelate epimerase [Tannerellaceae bacterium]